MKKLSLLILAFAFISAGKINADTIYVNVMNNFFDPANFSANVGDQVKWTLVEGSHTTSSMVIPGGAAAWNYTFTGIGDTYVYDVTVSGDYSYECLFHPGMEGTFLAATVNTLPFIEEFDYPVGDLLTQHGWVNHSGTGQFMTVISGSLSIAGYPSSGIGNSTMIEGGGGSREDVHQTFEVQSSGAVYAGFLVNVTAAAATHDYFLHFGPDPISTIFRGRVFVQDDGASGFKFGLSKTSTTTVSFTTSSFTYGETYLLVLKYEYIGDPTGSDDILNCILILRFLYGRTTNTRS
jgi:plastocyanin